MGGQILVFPDLGGERMKHWLAKFHSLSPAAGIGAFMLRLLRKRSEDRFKSS